MKRLIVNADDLGASTGINRGIFDAHVRGIVTSASFMVHGRAAAEAAAMARDHPDLSIGLHWDVWGEGEREFDLRNVDAARDEFFRQLDKFQQQLGRHPTHLDSHQHAHRYEPVRDLFAELATDLGKPLREASPVRYLGFHAQWEWGVTDLEHVSVAYIDWTLRNRVENGWTELGCHPGYVSEDFQSIYHAEREAEIQTLTAPSVRATLDTLGIVLRSFADFNAEQG